MVATAIAAGSELLITIIQAYMLAAKQQGLTAAQAKANFEKNFDAFMAESAEPVEAVKEA